MSKESTVKAVPVRPHIKQFFVSEYGPEPIQAHQRSLLGSAVLCVAQKLPYRILAAKAARPECSLLIKMPTALKHYSITVDNLEKLGYQLEKQFQRELIMFVKGQIAITQNENHALKMFYDQYNINPDDFDFENARKTWREYKDRILKDSEKKVRK